ncbi:hypothetical protein ALI144C_30980 [Actinosynnema sp. ALI-1.44]|uniref:sensor domain-containing protein n=1 Tax=Actinosynnema sp. ALI-1.44 TaxID=1933779 RepID=UPI00097BF7C9|nr:sensor domain-containing protein [Actinosynnema sp. ALI-1.44]ONI77849.1 hypothetical protein ALI144C_30980 [Actinosynnema sp. ALI-1.44]
MIIVVIAVGVVIGVGLGWWLWPSDTYAAPGTVQAAVLTADQVSGVVGETLVPAQSSSEPPPVLAADPANCVVAVGPATQAVYARGWTTFGSVTYQDSKAVSEHTVTQVLGMYPDNDRARQVFDGLTEGLKGCRSAVRANGSQRASKWTYAVDSATTDALGWTATQDGGNGWACYRQARLKGKAVLQVAVCVAGDGRQGAAVLADMFAGKVSG